MSINDWRQQNVLEEPHIVRSMSRDAGLAFWLILCAYRHQDGILKGDDQKLARTIGYTLKEWRGIKPELLEHFEIVDGYLRHTKSDIEIAKAKARSKTNSESGKKGAQARWTPDLVIGDHDE